MPPIDPFAFRAPSEVYFGSGELHHLGARARRLGSTTLITIGRGSVRAHGFLDIAQQSLHDAGIASTVYEGVAPEPLLHDVERGREAARASGADFIVALGGGSTLDVGKAIAALAHTSRPLTEYHSGGASCDEPGLPCVAIPTTAGTGSEATPNSVLTDPARGLKASIRGAALMPEIAIVDPALTLPLPPQPTAYSGLDALCQAIEAYVSRAANPVSDLWALRAVSAIAPSIRAAVQQGDALLHRENMALGSHLAGLALASARLGLVHGLAHPVGIATAKPHGLVCGALLPMAIRANADAVGDRYLALCHAAKLHAPDPPTAANALADWVEELCDAFGVPTRLSELGLTSDNLPPIAGAAANAGSTRFNPREMSEEAILSLMRQHL